MCNFIFDENYHRIFIVNKLTTLATYGRNCFLNKYVSQANESKYLTTLYLINSNASSVDNGYIKRIGSLHTNIFL